MDRNLQKGGFINLALLVLAGVATCVVARYTHSLAGQIAGLFLGLGALAAAVSAFQMRLEERERLEQLEFDELSRGASGTLFNTQEAEAFPARRSREQFDRFFVPGFTVLLFLLEAAGTWWLWQWLNRATVVPLVQPTVALGVFGVLALVLFLMGSYSAGLARLENQRLLRPGANHLLLGAYLLALVILAIVGHLADFRRVDLMVARALVLVLGLLATETLLGLILEIYRPRTKGVAARLLYDSRLIGLLSHPEGIFTTAAQALDYQFGFKVSETWFYQFLQQRFGWLLTAQVLVGVASTSLVFIESGEAALLERFGRPVAGREVLEPGLHFKWPWPVDRAHRFRTEQVQTFTVGVEAEADRAAENTVLWTVAHYKEEFNFLVASREEASLSATNAAGGRKRPPVNLLSGSVSFQYQIADLRAWAYHHTDAAALLKRLATREVVRHLVSADFNEIMSHGRTEAARALREAVQKQADDLRLGARIVFVGLQDIHPPVRVAPEFEEVVRARQKKQAALLAAESHQIETNALAGAEAFRREAEAEALRQRLEVSAYARAALFTNQLPAFRAAPTVYARRAYLQALARGSRGARKIIHAATNTQDVIQLDLEDKLSSLLLEPPLPASGAK